MVDPVHDYLLMIEDLFQTSEKGLCHSLFTRFRKELVHLIRQELAFHIPEGVTVSEKIMATDIEERIIQNSKDLPKKVLMAPAGGYALSISRCFDQEKIRVQAFFDNFKKGHTPDGLPILSPDQAGETDFDTVIVATPSYGAQTALRSQIESASKTHKQFVLTGDILLGRMASEGIKRTDKHLADACEKLKALKPEPGKHSIVFAVTSFPIHYVAHLRALRRNGHKVALVSLSDGIMYGRNFQSFAPEFDAAVTACHDPLLFFRMIRTLNCDVLYTVDHSLFNWFCLMIRDLFSGRHVHEVYDLSDNAGYAKGKGVKHVEKTWGIDMDALEDHCRNVLYAHVDSLIYRDSPDLMEKAVERFNIVKPRFRFLPYPDHFDQLKDVDGEDHIVFSGHILNNPDDLVYTVLDLARELTKQNIHMHVFNPADQTGTHVTEYAEEARVNPYFHYHLPLPPEFHNHCMRMFNWGWLVYDFKNQSKEDIERHAYTFTSRLLAYVNAGLPVICSEESTYQVDIIKKYGIGLVIPSKDVSRLSSLIQKTDMGAMKRNVMTLRNEWDMKTRYPEFETFLFSSIRP